MVPSFFLGGNGVWGLGFPLHGSWMPLPPRLLPRLYRRRLFVQVYSISRRRASLNFAALPACLESGRNRKGAPLAFPGKTLYNRAIFKTGGRIMSLGNNLFSARKRKGLSQEAALAPCFFMFPSGPTMTA